MKTLRQRVASFQAVLLKTIGEALTASEPSSSQYAAIATLTLLATAINAADDAGVFDDDQVDEFLHSQGYPAEVDDD